MATILVVDDEAPVAAVIAMALEEDGHAVDIAYSGREALRLARERRPDLAFIDLMLPYIDGKHLCLLLRDDPHTAGVPMILMSAGRPTDWQEIGAVSFLAKPFDLGAVSALARRHLRAVPE